MLSQCEYGWDINQICPADFVVGPFFLCVSPADAQPTEAEREIWEEVDVVLKDAKAILDELQAYKGAGPDIREVRSSTPSLQDTLMQNYKEMCI